VDLMCKVVKLIWCICIKYVLVMIGLGISPKPRKNKLYLSSVGYAIGPSVSLQLIGFEFWMTNITQNSISLTP
jgi:hypothetical protein